MITLFTFLHDFIQSAHVAILNLHKLLYWIRACYCV